MEFLTITATIAASVSKLLQLGWHQFRQRSKVLREIEANYKGLASAAVSAGRQIQSYLEFDRLVAQIKRATNTLLDNNNRIVKDDDFWNITEPTHRQLHEAVCVTLNNFDVTRFQSYHDALITGARPTIFRLIQESEAMFNTHQREEYVGRLREALLEIARLEGLGVIIIQSLGTGLAEFEGTTDGSR